MTEPRRSMQCRLMKFVHDVTTRFSGRLSIVNTKHCRHQEVATFALSAKSKKVNFHQNSTRTQNLFSYIYFVAYHVICRDCAIKNKQCAKCLKKDSEVEIIPAGPTPEEQLREKVETMAMIKSLPERKRRTILRQRRKKKPVEGEEGEDDGQEGVEMENGLAKKKTASQSDDEFYDGISEGDDENDDDEWASDDFSSGEEEPKNKI